MSEGSVTWSRVKELLDGIMHRWEARHGEPALGVHDFYWDTPQKLADHKPFGRQLIEPGNPGRGRTSLDSYDQVSTPSLECPTEAPF